MPRRLFVTAGFRKPIMFFLEGGDSELERELAELNTPETARRWHYLMNMPFDSFASLFKKATGHAAARTG
jgi:hypothetical protein